MLTWHLYQCLLRNLISQTFTFNPTVKKTRMKENKENASVGKHWLVSFIPKVYVVKSEQICAVYS